MTHRMRLVRINTAAVAYSDTGAVTGTFPHGPRTRARPLRAAVNVAAARITPTARTTPDWSLPPSSGEPMLLGAASEGSAVGSCAVATAALREGGAVAACAPGEAAAATEGGPPVLACVGVAAGVCGSCETALPVLSVEARTPFTNDARPVDLHRCKGATGTSTRSLLASPCPV